MTKRHYKLLKDDFKDIYIYDFKDNKSNKRRIILYRIEATIDLPHHNVRAGDKGGYVESEYNLCDKAWVEDNACVCDEAKVYERALIGGNATVYGMARVYGNARVSGFARIYDNAQVYGRALIAGARYAEVYGMARVYEDAKISGDARIFDYAQVYGSASVFKEARVFYHAEVCDLAQISGEAEIRGKAKIHGITRVQDSAEISCGADVGSDNDFCYFSKFGSDNERFTFFREKNGNVYVNGNCFRGDLEEFERKIKKSHRGNKYQKEYLKMIELVKIKFEIKHRSWWLNFFE